MAAPERGEVVAAARALGGTIMEPTHHNWFETTHWTTVLMAKDGDSREARYAVENLCRYYWYPLYAYVRHRGYKEHDAQDLTQEFFTQFLARNYLQEVHPSKGRFRNFLLACLNHFLAKERRKWRAQKRGGALQMISVDEETAEGRYRLELADGLTPEAVYNRRWALDILGRVLQGLARECAEQGKAELFQHLRGYLAQDEELPGYRDLARSLGMTESAVKKAMERLRDRYRELLRQEIAATVSSPDQIDDEIDSLILAIRRPGAASSG